MKIQFAFVLAGMVLISCSRETKSPLEGTWRCISEGSVQLTDTGFQAMTGNGLIKTFSKRYFTFVGHIANDTVSLDQFGAGTYTLNGNEYEELVIYHDVKSLIGKTFKAIDEIRNDTLIHRYNSDTVNNWKLDKGYVTEKYVRLK